jgi:hypothetical protein
LTSLPSTSCTARAFRPAERRYFRLSGSKLCTKIGASLRLRSLKFMIFSSASSSGWLPAGPQPLAMACALFQIGFLVSGYTVSARPVEALLALAMSITSWKLRIGSLPLSSVGRWSLAS